MNTTTTRSAATAAETRAGRGASAPASAPFAALPHDLAADTRLSPTDVRVLLALLFWARSRAACWPSDRSIALRIGRSVGTVQRALRRLEALGLVERRRADNPTGRELVLRWRATPTSPALDPPASRARDEGECEEKKNRPSSAAGREGPPPPAGETIGAEAPPSAEDLAQLTAWAQGPDPALARFGKAALKLAGVDPDAVVQTDPIPCVVHGDNPHALPEVPAVEPVATPARTTASTPAQARPMMPTIAATTSASLPWSQGLPRLSNAQARQRTGFPGLPRRPDCGPRHVLDQLVGAMTVLPVRASPGCAAPV